MKTSRVDATRFVNIDGTSGHRCFAGCANWSAHLRLNGGKYTRAKKCAVHGCRNDWNVGAHVEIVDGMRRGHQGIVGLCKTHNHRSMNEPQMFRRGRDTVLVPHDECDRRT